MEAHPYRQAFEARDLDRLLPLLADDVIFHTPILSELAFEGPDAVAPFLTFVLDAFEDVEFTHDLGDEDSQVLIYDARVLDKAVKATWLLELDAEGKIREIWVMIRPLTGLTAIVEAAGRRLAERRGTALSELSKPLADLAAEADRAAAGLLADLNRSAT
jgi:hypothetical protein